MTPADEAAAKAAKEIWNATDALLHVAPSIDETSAIISKHIAPVIEALERRLAAAEAKLAEVYDLIDDVLYNPVPKPVDIHGNPIRGDERYLLDLPIMEDHLPALRQWFVKRTREAAEAEAKP